MTSLSAQIQRNFRERFRWSFAMAATAAMTSFAHGSIVVVSQVRTVSASTTGVDFDGPRTDNQTLNTAIPGPWTATARSTSYGSATGSQTSSILIAGTRVDITAAMVASARRGGGSTTSAGASSVLSLVFDVVDGPVVCMWMYGMSVNTTSIFDQSSLVEATIRTASGPVLSWRNENGGSTFPPSPIVHPALADGRYTLEISSRAGSGRFSSNATSNWTITLIPSPTALLLLSGFGLAARRRR